MKNFKLAIRFSDNCKMLLRGGRKEDNVRVVDKNTDNVDLDDVFENSRSVLGCPKSFFRFMWK